MGELVLWTDAKRAVAALRSTDEVRTILDKSVAMQEYAKRSKDTSLVVQATEVREHAERRLGELMATMPKAEGAKGNPGGRGAPIVRVAEKPTQPTLSSLGIDKNLANRARKKAKLSEEVFETHVKTATRRAAKAVEDKKAFRAEERAARDASLIRRAAAFPDKKYHILLADPPWRYDNAPAGDPGRAVENHYPTKTVADIAALADPAGRPITDLPATDALLYLWTTSPKLADSLAVVAAWGFDYRTCLVWVKDKIGTGYHARAQHELVLIGRRGQIPPPPPELRQPSVIFAERGRHSEKPVELYERIEAAYPDLAKVELFCRSPRPGWDVWGYEASDAA